MDVIEQTHRTATHSTRIGKGDGWLAICHSCDWEGKPRRARDTAESEATMHRAGIEHELTDPQRDAILHTPYRSKFSKGKLVMSGRSCAVNVRTARRLAQFGMIELHEGYSRQDGGNVWTATVTPYGERVRNAMIPDA